VDEDIEKMSREELIAEAKKLRAGIAPRVDKPYQSPHGAKPPPSRPYRADDISSG